MDETTSAVRDMYEKFPYPTGSPVNRVGSDVELVLSYGEVERRNSLPHHVLDAGCGRGLGVLGAATLQPQVQFLGVDINRVALTEATSAAKERGLSNVRFQECDLMNLAEVEAPPGGFDVIHSSGVLHHLSDPLAGLLTLKEYLAPHGMINLMVYGRFGREPLMQTAAAIKLLFPADVPLGDQVMPARTVAALAAKNVLAGTRFQDTYQVDDVEFVDRCLNVNETSYDVPSLWGLMHEAGLRFIRWVEPSDWTAEHVLPDGWLRQRLAELPEEIRYQFLELILQPAGLELIAAHTANQPRAPLAPEQIAPSAFRLNPELLIGTETRHAPAGVRIETMTFTLRRRDPITVPRGPFATALMILTNHTGGLTGKKLLRELQANGLSETDSQAVILELVRQEILMRPH